MRGYQQTSFFFTPLRKMAAYSSEQISWMERLIGNLGDH
jgi:hypothetical protein